MIGPSVTLLLAGILLMFVTPVERAFSRRGHRRQVSAVTAELALREIAARREKIAHLIAAADAELERDPLIRGVRGVAEIYDRA